MATILSCSIPATIRASSRSSPGSRKPDSNRKKPVSSVSWWAPLFGWSSDPDYVKAETSSASRDSEESEISGSGQEPGRSEHRFTRGCFTDKKAKELRKKMAESSSFHDVMYHSAIASRLASDVSSRRVEK